MKSDVLVKHGLSDADDNNMRMVSGLRPPGWNAVAVGLLVDQHTITLTNGFAQGGYNEDGDGVPHLRPFNVTEDGRIDLAQIKSVPAPKPNSPYWLKPGDVILNNTNSEDLVGKTAYFALEGPFVLSNHMTRIRVHDYARLDAQWLAEYFQFLWNRQIFKTLCRRHVGQASISLDKLGGLVIPLPPLAEQCAIARVLRAVREAIAARRRELALERERKAALMAQLFTHGTRGEPTQQTAIGEMPQSWRVVPFGQMCISSAYGPRFGAEHYSASGNVATVRTTDMDANGEINHRTMPRAELDLRRFKDHLLQRFDVLITRSGTCGIAAVFEEFEIPVLPGAFSIRFRLRREQLDPYFVRYYINSPHGQARVSLLAVGAVQKNISGTSMLAFPIPVPSLEDQQEIVEVLQRQDRASAALSQEIILLKELFRALLEELMSGRLAALPLVQVEVNPTG